MILGDIHLRAKNLKDLEHAFHSIIQWSHDNKVNCILQAGDIFDSANIHGKDASTGKVFSAFINPFLKQKNKTKFITVVGNHDLAFDSDVLTTLDGYDWIKKVFRKPEVIEIDKGISVCGFPWIEKYNLLQRLIKSGKTNKEGNEKINELFSNILIKLKEQVQEHKDKGNIVIFLGHLELQGSVISKDGQLQSGGSFQFTPSEISSLNCDIYGCAHIHIRQKVLGLKSDNDGFIGTICQLGFGEESNVCGFRYIEIDDGQIITDKFIDNGSSPKYFTTDSIETLDYRKGIDYVKLTGDIKPDDLPDNVIFQPLPKEVKKRRIEEHLDSDTELSKLLSSWKLLNDCEANFNDLLKYAEKLKIECTPKFLTGSIGSLQRINSIKLQNIKSHKNTFIDFKGFDGPIGLFGDTGSGKSTLVESIALALYNTTPQNSSVQNDWIPNGFVGESLCEVNFTSGDKEYIITRRYKKTNKNFTQEAELVEINDGNSIPIAAGVNQVYKQICLLVSEPDLFYSGAFSTTNDAGHILSCSPTERKELFAKLLKTDIFLEMSKISKGSFESAQGIIQMYQESINHLLLEIPDENSINQKIEALRNKIIEYQQKMTEFGNNSESIKVKIKEEENIRNEIERLNKLGDTLKNKLVEIQSNGAKLKKTKEDLINNSSEDTKNQLTNDLNIAKEAKEHLDSLKEQRLIDEQENGLVLVKINQLKQEINDLKQNRENSYNEYYNKTIEDLNIYKNSINNKINQYDKDLGVISNNINILKNNIEQAEQQVRRLEGFPDVEICKSCIFASQGIESRESLPKLNNNMILEDARYKELQKEKDNYINVQKYEFNIQKNNICKKESWQTDILEVILLTEKRIEDLNKEIKVNKISIEEQNLINVIKTIPEIELKLNSIKDNSEELIKIDADLNNLRTHYKSINDEIVAIILPKSKEDEYALSMELKELNKQYNSSQQLINNDMKEIGKNEAILESLNKKKSDIMELRTKIDDKSKELTLYDAAMRAFGKDGVPMLIIDNLVPRLENLMADLLSKLGSSNFNISMSTQKKNQNGNLKEEVQILINDREINSFSNGERKILKNIIRMAFAQMQFEKSNKGIKIMILDESVDGVSDELAGNFIDLLKSNDSQFNQIFIISHKNDVLGSINNKISFENLNGESKVEQICL